MSKIMLFGSSTISVIPTVVIQWLETYVQQGHSFIVGDCKGADSAFHRALSSVGAQDVTVYCMESARSNDYDYKTKVFNTFYNEDAKEVTIKALDNSIEPFIISDVKKEMDIQHTRQWYEFKDRQMIQDCDAAVCVWDKESKGTFHAIQLLNIANKPCYTVTMQV